ncbi:hypothetical protein [Streptomyces sp. NRRL B-24484]|uniref:hypothetical protein n=1 Tax=Streptomyces sp. NRRL B-24484 TaxID=1463833 RepID=UPI00190089FC|nr:hypothetical protein [Streptomyces sp. NRRL B-24484]
MIDLASELSGLPEARGDAPWPGHEYAKGWGVFGLPLSSGHVLALRAFPESSFGPYRTVWHRTPDGRWSIHVDGPRPDTACPRYFGPACEHTGPARIRLTWTGPASLRVTMDAPSPDWSLTARSTPVLALMNAVGSVLPLATRRSGALARSRELMARALGLGSVRMTGVMPSGHTGTLMPARMYYVADSRAVLDGTDLGRPVRLHRNPRIGEVPLPARGVLAVGQAAWRIRDPAA